MLTVTETAGVVDGEVVNVVEDTVGTMITAVVVVVSLELEVGSVELDGET